MTESLSIAQLDVLIINTLRSEPSGLAAKHILKMIGKETLNKTAINSRLYNLLKTGTVTKSEDTCPVWKLD